MSSSTTWLNIAFTSLSNPSPSTSTTADAILLHGLSPLPRTHILHHLNRWAKVVWRTAVDACALAEFRRVASLDTLMALGTTAVSLLHATCTSMKQCHVLQWIPVIGIMLFADDPNALGDIITHHHNINTNNNGHVHSAGPVDVVDDDDAVVHAQVGGHDSVTTTTVTNLVDLDEMIQIDAVCAFLFKHHSQPLESAMSHFSSSLSSSHSSSSSSVSTPATISTFKASINNNNNNSTNDITNKSPATTATSHRDDDGDNDDDIRGEISTLHAKVTELSSSVRRNEQLTNELLTSFQFWSMFLLEEVRGSSSTTTHHHHHQQQQENDERLRQLNNAMVGMSKQVLHLNKADINGVLNITQSLHDVQLGHHHHHHSTDMAVPTPKASNNKPTTPTTPLHPRSLHVNNTNHHHHTNSRVPSSAGSSSSLDFTNNLPHMPPTSGTPRHHQLPFATGHPHHQHLQTKQSPQPPPSRQGSAGNGKKGRRIFRDGQWITQ